MHSIILAYDSLLSNFLSNCKVFATGSKWSYTTTRVVGDPLLHKNLEVLVSISLTLLQLHEARTQMIS